MLVTPSELSPAAATSWRTTDRATVAEPTEASISATASGVTRIASTMDPAAATRSSPIGAGNGVIEARRERVGAEVRPIIVAAADDSVPTRRTGMCRVGEKAPRQATNDPWAARSPRSVRTRKRGQLDSCRRGRCMRCTMFVQSTRTSRPVKEPCSPRRDKQTLYIAFSCSIGSDGRDFRPLPRGPARGDAPVRGGAARVPEADRTSAMPRRRSRSRHTGLPT